MEEANSLQVSEFEKNLRKRQHIECLPAQPKLAHMIYP